MIYAIGNFIGIEVILLKRLLAFFTVLLMLLPLGNIALADASDDFFNDSVFLGDSLTVGLESFAKSQRKKDRNFLGDAQFLAESGYAIDDTDLPDGHEDHPEYDGQRLQPQKSLAAMDPEKVFITLGVNDVNGKEKTLAQNYKALIRSIKKAVPDAKLYMIAVFPMTARKESSSRNNSKIDSINVRLLSLAMSEGVTFIDFTDSLKEDGVLKAEYSRDDYVHLSNDGYSVWTKSLYAFARFQLAKSDVNTGTATIVNVKNYVNARKKASSSSKLVTTIKKGEKVTILESASGNWYKVSYEGETMYVYGKYLSVGGSSGLVGEVDNVSKDANLRELPDTESNRAAKVKKGTQLSVSKDYFNSNWYQVEYKGETAYISRELLELQ